MLVHVLKNKFKMESSMNCYLSVYNISDTRTKIKSCRNNKFSLDHTSTNNKLFIEFNINHVTKKIKIK